MVTRIWHGRTKAEDAQRYLEFLLEEGTNDYRQTDGNITTRVWRNKTYDTCDFWTVTEWKDIESIKMFAGENYQLAKYYPFDDKMLLEFERHVSHYESYDISNLKIRNYIVQLERLYHGGNWVGESIAGKLKDLNDMQVFSQPVSGVHSVAELLWHCIYWRKVTLSRLNGDNNHYRDETVDDLNFLPLEKLKAKGFNMIVREFEETQVELTSFLRDKSDRFLENEYQSGYTYEFLLEGTIQHDYYHLGQIGLALKILSIANQQ